MRTEGGALPAFRQCAMPCCASPFGERTEMESLRQGLASHTRWQPHAKSAAEFCTQLHLSRPCLRCQRPLASLDRSEGHWVRHYRAWSSFPLAMKYGNVNTPIRGLVRRGQRWAANRQKYTLRHTVLAILQKYVDCDLIEK